jgi:hypothetical protein
LRPSRLRVGVAARIDHFRRVWNSLLHAAVVDRDGPYDDVHTTARGSLGDARARLGGSVGCKAS